MALTQPPSHPLMALADAADDKNTRSRLLRFVAFQRENDQVWHHPDLAAYDAALQQSGLAASTRTAYISTIRGAYRDLLRQNATRDTIAALVREAYPGATLSDILAAVNEKITRMENQLNSVTITTVTKQDRADSEHRWLEPRHARQLMNAPLHASVNEGQPLRSLRDAALVALMLSTGLREAEVVNLVMTDLRQHLDGELAVMVRAGKGAKQRLVPYGELSGCLLVIERWREVAAITEDTVFVSLDRWGKVIGEPMSRRSIQRVLKRYPLIIDGQRLAVKPHDLRRTYARMLYRSGLPLTAIQENLGHERITTTRGYIGSESGKRRRGKNGYGVDFTALIAPRLL